MIDLGQRSLDDYAPDGLGLLTVVGMKSPRYGKGYKYCSSCREAFLTISKLCPRCGMRLRSKPRRENFRNM
jgi:predicted amidophosphoribosyltransferase